MKHIREFESFLNEAVQKDDRYYLFWCFYFSESKKIDRKVIDEINNLLGEDTGNAANDWDSTSDSDKIRFVKVYR